MSQDRATDHADAGGTNVAWLVVGLVGLVGFVLLTVAVWARIVFPFDQPLLTVTHSWDGNPDVWKVVSGTANIPLIVIGLGFVIWLFVTKRRREAVLVLLMLAAVTAG